jgi:hypothetical protein
VYLQSLVICKTDPRKEGGAAGRIFQLRLDDKILTPAGFALDERTTGPSLHNRCYQSLSTSFQLPLTLDGKSAGEAFR